MRAAELWCGQEGPCLVRRSDGCLPPPESMAAVLMLCDMTGSSRSCLENRTSANHEQCQKLKIIAIRLEAIASRAQATRETNTLFDCSSDGNPCGVRPVDDEHVRIPPLRHEWLRLTRGEARLTHTCTALKTFELIIQHSVILHCTLS